MSKFTIYILLIVAVFIGGAQEMMRRNGTASNRLDEVTPQPILAPVAGTQALPSNPTRENSPIPDSDSSKVTVAMTAKPGTETNVPQPKTPKSETTPNGIDEQIVQSDFSKNAVGEKSSILKQPEPSFSNIVAKYTTDSPDNSKIESNNQATSVQPVPSQTVTTLKPLRDLLADRRDELISAASLIKANHSQDQGSPVDQPLDRTTVNKIGIDDPLKHTVLQPRETEEERRLREEKSQREAERKLAELRLDAQFLYRRTGMNPEEKIRGTEVKLEDVIRSNDRQSRLRSIRAYWNVVVAMIDYHWAYSELSQLQIVNSTQNDTVQAKLLQAAYDACWARFRETRAAMITAQFELQSTAGLRELPIAIDIPLVEKYNTRLKVYYPNQVPPRMLAINETLDLRLQTIASRVYAERWADDSFMMAMDMYKRKTLESQYIIIAYEQLTKHRRALLASVRDYNFEIGEYVITTVGDRSAAAVADALTHNPNPNPNRAKQTSFESGAPMLAPEQQFSDPRVQPATTFKNPTDDDWGRVPANEMQSIMKRDGQ